MTGTWLDPQDPQSNAQALLTGTVWTEQPSFRWVAGLEAQVVTLRGYAAGEELVVSLTDDQLICLERARGQEQRWAAIYWHVKSMANAAHHDDSTTQGFSWSRADAEAILGGDGGAAGKVYKVAIGLVRRQGRMIEIPEKGPSYDSRRGDTSSGTSD